MAPPPPRVSNRPSLDGSLQTRNCAITSKTNLRSINCPKNFFNITRTSDFFAENTTQLTYNTNILLLSTLSSRDKLTQDNWTYQILNSEFHDLSKQQNKV